MTWPVATRMLTHLAGGRDDLWVHQWTFWWILQALREGLNPFYTKFLYFPHGVSLTSHNVAWFNIALWLPLQAVAGRIAAYNLVFLIGITLNGFTMYLFAHALTKSRLGALIAGLIFGFWPYTLSHYDHANMMILFWVPLSLFCLHNLINKASADRSKFHWWWLTSTALTIAMIGITRWQLLIMAAPILFAYTILLLVKSGHPFQKQTLLQLLIAAGIALILMAPLASPLLVDQFTREFPEDVFLDEPQWGRTDLLAYFVPSIHNGLWRNFVSGIYQNFVVNQFYTPYLGYITLLLALMGLSWRWKKTWFWLLLALIYFLLALGPVLAVNGLEYPQIPMPYRLVEDLIFLRILRRPDRLNIFLSLPLALIAAWGMKALSDRIPNARLQKLTVTAVVLLILLAYSPIPFATTKPETPDWYARAAATNEQFAVLDLPLNDRSYDKRYMQYQTDHGMPLATGHVSRLPGEAFDFLDSVPLTQNLRQRDQLPDPNLTAISDQLRLLHEAGIHYIVIHKDFTNDGLQAVWRDWLTISPSYEDDELIVYRTKPLFEQDFTYSTAMTPDIGIINAQFSPAEAVQAGAIALDVRWGTADNPSASYDLCLLLTTAARIVAHKDCQPLDPNRTTVDWRVNDVHRGNYIVPLPEDIEPGPYQIELSLAPAGSSETLETRASLGDVYIHPFTPARTITANWQDQVHLTGYDMETDQDKLILTLFWQADKPLAASYKVFVHLVDQETGQIIYQSDSIPRQWTYPTTSWQTAEIVRDRITLDGYSDNYEIRVGLYDDLTGERLLVTGSESPNSQDFLSLGMVKTK